MRARTRKVLQLTCPPPTLTVRADEALHASTPPLARLRACAARPKHPCPGCHRAEPDREAVVDINHRRGHVDSHAQQQSPPRRHAQPHVQRSAATTHEAGISASMPHAEGEARSRKPWSVLSRSTAPRGRSRPFTPSQGSAAQCNHYGGVRRRRVSCSASGTGLTLSSGF